MSGALIAGCIWVVAAAITALLPMRRQYPPGIALLIAAPVLLVWIGIAHGWIVAGLCLLGFGSMFRNPLIHLTRRLRGRR